MSEWSELFSSGDHELVVEALHTLLERKREALHEAAQHPQTAMFTAQDFGIPKIDAILKRLDAEPLSPHEARIGSDYARSGPLAGAQTAPADKELLHVDNGMISPDECFPQGEWVAIATGAFMNDEEGVVALAHPARARRLVACFNACAAIPTGALEAGELRTVLTNAASVLRDTREGFPESELVESPEVLLQRLGRLGFVDEVDLERIRDLCERCDIRLVEATEDEVRGRWDWIDGDDNASDASFATESEAGLDALKGHFAIDLAHLGPELSDLQTTTAFLDYVERLQDAAGPRPGMGG